MEGEVAGLVDDVEGGGVLEAHRVGDLAGQHRQGVGTLGVAALEDLVDGEAGGDAVAGGEAGVGRRRDHRPGDLAPGCEGEVGLGLVGAGDHQRVEEVDRRRLDLETEHVGRGIALRDVLEGHRVGITPLAHHPSLHRSPILASSGASGLT